MDWSDKWLGVAGGGFGFSLIGGMGAYQLNLWNMAGGNVPLRVLVFGKRLGLTAQAEAAHAVCFLSGVPSPNSFTEIKSSGVDWALALGLKADSLVKGGSKAAKAVAEIATSTGNWASHEGAKKAVQGLMGDFSTSSSSPSFVLLPTPVAVAVGAGIWYEWQTMTKVGTDIAWEYVTPVWSLENAGQKVILKMHNIPEADGATLNFHIREKVFGSDNLISFANREGGQGSILLSGTVQNGRLTDPANSIADGFDLTSRIPVGKTEIGMLSVSKTKEVTKSDAVSIGVSVCQGRINLYRWESDDYAKVLTDAKGAFMSAKTTSLLS